MLEHVKYRFHHVGIPVKTPIEGEVYLKDYGTDHCGCEKSEFCIEKMWYDADRPLPEIVTTVAHAAFEIDGVYEAVKGRNVIMAPNSPSADAIIAFIEENGVPVEFIRIRGTV